MNKKYVTLVVNSKHLKAIRQLIGEEEVQVKGSTEIPIKEGFSWKSKGIWCKIPEHSFLTVLPNRVVTLDMDNTPLIKIFSAYEGIVVHADSSHRHWEKYPAFSSIVKNVLGMGDLQALDKVDKYELTREVLADLYHAALHSVRTGL